MCDVDWHSIKGQLQELATRHHGRLVDFGMLVELVPPQGGPRIRLSGLDPESVRIEAGWFLQLDVELAEDGHLTEVVTALITGHATEFISVRDSAVLADGFLVDYPGGSRGTRPESPDPHASERRLQAWSELLD